MKNTITIFTGRPLVWPLLTALVLAGAAWWVWPADQAVMAAMHGIMAGVPDGDPLRDLVRLVRPFGKGQVLALLAALAAMLGWRRLGLRVLAALLLAGVLVWPLKVGVGRERPDGSNRVSFPSGDVASVAAVAVPVVVAAPLLAPTLAAALVPLAGAGVAVVALGRLADGKHHPSDVLAGAALGLLAGWLAVRLTPWLLRRRLRRRHFAWAALALAAVGMAGVWRGKADAFDLFLMVWGPALGLLLFTLRSRVWRRRLRPRLPSVHGWFEKHQGWLAAALLAIIMGVYLFVAMRSTLWDRDEPRFARATVEMVASGDWLVPTFNGVLRADKPILVYWLWAPLVWLFGGTELAVRLWAVLGTGVACYCCYLLGKKLFDWRAGMVAMLVLGTTPNMVASGTAATTDAVLLATVLLGLTGFGLTLADGFKRWHVLLLVLSFSLGLLVKGPVGPVVTLLGMIGCRLLLYREKILPKGYWWWVAGALLTGIAFFLAWGIPANIATDGRFFKLGVGRHVVARSLEPIDHHGGRGLRYVGFMFYYLPVLLLTFFPWTLLLPGALVTLWRGRLGGAKMRALLLGWIVLPFILMSLVATKLPHYILACLAGLSVAVAALMVARTLRSPQPEDECWTRRGAWLFAPVGYLLGMALLLAPWWLPLPSARLALMGAGVLVLAMTALALRDLPRASLPGGAGPVLVVGMLLLALAGGLWI
ncbi:MAG: glycosyltransferase family 39 protein, partial [Lentisphaeria bacterium]